VHLNNSFDSETGRTDAKSSGRRGPEAWSANERLKTSCGDYISTTPNLNSPVTERIAAML
jgi:hypothetical protein